jgi:adenosine kinase
MLRHSDECRSRGISFAADPSQQLAFCDGPTIARLIEGAEYLFTNEYESHLTCQKTGWSEEQLADAVRVQVTTRGKDGVVVRVRGEEPVEVGIAREVRKADPTGVGDAFRAGFLTGLATGLPVRRCAELGSMLATYVIETVGTQEYVLGKARFLERLAEAYGPESADEIGPHVTCPRP